MYDRGVTNRAIEAASRAQGWALQAYNVSQVDLAITHFNNLWDPEERKLKRPLTDEEQRFITNERKMCALDFLYWTERYAWIVDWQKRPSRFTPNVAQSIIINLWAESESQGHAIWMQQLKARRLGASTVAELGVQHRYQFHPYSNCVVASADPDKTVEMAGVIKYSLDQQPWWLLPRQTKIYKGIPIEFGDIHCNLTIQAGNQFNGVARGSSPSVCHLSELCEWMDAEDLIEGALLPAILDTPDVFGILESTAKGPGWWKNKWEQNKRDYPRGRSKMRPVFLPWFVGTDLYPTAADLRKRPIPPDWIPSDRTIAHAERARAYVTTDPLLLKYLAKGDKDWKMPRAQMWWREMGYESAKDSKTLNIFLAEYAGDDFEAFQSSNIPVIDPEILLGYQERTRPPIAVYTIIGPEIPPAMVTPSRYWNQNEPTITISTRELLPRHDAKYQLVPLQFNGYPSFDESMKLLVWEEPMDHHIYGLGNDCSEGLGQDNAIFQVMREATPYREPGQVAEWASNTTTAFQLWPLVMAVGCWYSTLSAQTGRRAQCRLAIESQSNGAALQNEIKKRGWTNFHPRMYNDSRKPRREGETAGIGVLMNHWFRTNMLDMLLTCLSEEAIDLPSPYLVQELTTLERAADTRKAKAAPDAYDDRVMALGIILFSLHMNKPPIKQYGRKRVSYAPGLQEDDGVAHPIWTPPVQAQSRAFTKVTQRVYRDSRFGSLQRVVNRGMPKGFQ